MSTPGSNSFPVQFNGYPLGSIQMGFSFGVSRAAVERKAPRVKGCSLRGMGGGKKTWSFETIQEFDNMDAALTWADGLGTAVGHSEHDLSITTNGGTHTYSGAVCLSYGVSGLGSKHLTIRWTFEMTETEMGTVGTT